MQEYKFYYLDDLGHIFRAQDQILPDDLTALEAAQKLRSDRVVEVWQFSRRVARVQQDGDAVSVSDGQWG
jgi:hypothetical protein